MVTPVFSNYLQWRKTPSSPERQVRVIWKECFTRNRKLKVFMLYVIIICTRVKKKKKLVLAHIF